MLNMRDRVIPVSILSVFALASLACSDVGSIEKEAGAMNHGMKMVSGMSGGKSQPNTLTTGSKQTINALQTSFPHASTYTVQFAVTPPKATGSQGVFGAEALITWMLEGNAITRRVSVGNGISVSGTGQGVQVQLVDTTIDSGQTLGATYEIVVSVTPGVRASQAQLVTLQQPSPLPTHNILPAASSVVFPIPQDAGAIAVQVLATSVAFPASQPQILVVITTLTQSQKQFTVPPESDFVSIPPNATQVNLFNLDPVNNAFVTVTWGIDG